MSLIVIAIAVQILILVPMSKSSECNSTRDQCIPVHYCPHIQEAIESGDVYRNSSLYDYVWSRTCHEADQEPRVCCEPEQTTLGKQCHTVPSQGGSLEGSCVASDRCAPIEQYLKRKKRNIAFDRILAKNVCYQDGGGKEYYCCPEVHVSKQEKKNSKKKEHNRVLRVKNAFPPCHDPNGQAGLCVPVRHCDHIHAAFLDSRIKHDAKLAEFVHASWCKSDALTGNSICCAKPKPSGSDGGFIHHQKAAKLGLKRCGTIPFTNRILQGSEAGLGQNPWMASLLYRRKDRITSLCSGSLIHPRYVLTAAHCMQGSTKPIAVRLGEYDTSSNPDCDDSGCAAPIIDYEIARLIPNENFNGRDANHDIALVKLKQEVILSDGEIYPICLPITNHLLMMKPTKLMVTGWGMTEHQKQSKLLLEAELQLVQRTSFCEGESTSCMRGKHSEGHCRGDSGGPLQTTVPIGRGYRTVLFAVVSGGSGECNANKKQPGVGVMVGYHINWILDQMEI